MPYSLYSSTESCIVLVLLHQEGEQEKEKDVYGVWEGSVEENICT